MSPSVYVTTRKRPSPTGGITVRYLVRYRLGGRAFPLVHAGSFKTLKEARARRDFIAAEIAAGRNPAASLRQLASPPVRRTYADIAADYRASRVDLDRETVKNIGSHLTRLLPIFAETDPGEQTVQDQIDAVAQLSVGLKPSSVARYWATHRLILDFAGVDPNPARDEKVKLPPIISTEVVPPPAAHVLAMLDRIPARWLLPLVTIEQTGMAVGETGDLTWGDVDVPSSRFRLRRATVKARIRARARWVQVPDWLMDTIADTCPPEDRDAGRRVFPGFTADAAKNAMARACRAAEIPVYSPHDLRHRRLSLWHGQGIPAKELANRAGHAKASMTLDVYSHVMPLEEVPVESLRTVLVRSR